MLSGEGEIGEMQKYGKKPSPCHTIPVVGQHNFSSRPMSVPRIREETAHYHRSCLKGDFFFFFFGLTTSDKVLIDLDHCLASSKHYLSHCIQLNYVMEV